MLGRQKTTIIVVPVLMAPTEVTNSSYHIIPDNFEMLFIFIAFELKEVSSYQVPCYSLFVVC
jgi:hypothetical protein